MIFRGVMTGGSGIQKSSIAAEPIPYGAVVTYSADGKIKAALGTPAYSYLGVAVDSIVEQPREGFFPTNSHISYITEGSANVWLLGGEVLASGDFVRLPATLGLGTERLGIVAPEGTATTKTLYTIGKFIGQANAGDAAYDQSMASISGVTCTCAGLASLAMKKGDFVVIDSNEGAEMNVVDNPAVTATSFSCTVAPLATHANAIKVYKLVQVEVLLL
jgi:hypothetical protein